MHNNDDCTYLSLVLHSHSLLQYCHCLLYNNCTAFSMAHSYFYCTADQYLVCLVFVCCVIYVLVFVDEISNQIYRLLIFCSLAMCTKGDKLFFLFSPSVLPRTVRCITMLAYMCIGCVCVRLYVIFCRSFGTSEAAYAAERNAQNAFGFFPCLFVLEKTVFSFCVKLFDEKNFCFCNNSSF